MSARLFSRFSFLALTALSVAGCSSMNAYLGESEQEVGYYRIYDVQTTASGKAVIDVLQKSIASDGAKANFSYSPYYLKVKPQKAERFIPLGLINPMQAKMSPNAPEFAGYVGISCPRSAWTANTVRNDGTYLQACLYPYKHGYQVSLFARFLKKRGKLSDMTSSVVNYAGHDTDESWAEHLFEQVPAKLRKDLSAQVDLLESLPVGYLE